MGLTETPARAGFVALNAALIGALAFLAPVTGIWLADGSLHPVYQSLMWLAGGWWLLSLALIVSYPGSEKLWQNPVVKGVMGLLTLVPAWGAFVAIRTLNIDVQFYYGASLLFASLTIVWAADIGAYFFGKSLGKRKLMPKVSPNKTIEGFLGGLLTVAIFIWLLMVGFEVQTDLYPVYLMIGVITAGGFRGR